MRQVVYTLRFDVSGCSYLLTVNDMPIVSENKGYPLFHHFDINEFISTGVNEFFVELSPLPEEVFLKVEAECSVVIIENDKMTGLVREIAQQKSPLFQDKKTSSYRIRGNFDTVLPFSVSRMFSGELLSLDEQLLTQVRRIYTKYHDHLRDNDVRSLITMTYSREQEIAQCYYTSVGERVGITSSKIQQEIDDPQNKLYPLYFKRIVPKLHCFGKVISLQISGMESPICLVNWSAGITTYFPLYLCKADNGELIVIR